MTAVEDADSVEGKQASMIAIIACNGNAVTAVHHFLAVPKERININAIDRLAYLGLLLPWQIAEQDTACFKISLTSPQKIHRLKFKQPADFEILTSI